MLLYIPFGIEHIISIAIILILLLFSGFFSASEVAFFSLSASTLDEIKESNPKAYLRVSKLLEKPKFLLAFLLIANNLVNIGIVIISTYFTNITFDFQGNFWLLFFIQVVAITAIILIFGESLPKTLATQRSKGFAIKASKMVVILEKLFRPFSFLLVRSTNVIDRNIGSRNIEISMDELSQAIELTSDHKTTEDDKKILKGITKFRNVEAVDIMTRRMDVVAIDENTVFSEVLNLIRGSGYSRVPVYSDTLDNVIGILYIKDLLPHIEEENYNWKKLIRNPYFVPEGKKINDLLKEFQQRKIHMAIVVDEYGGSSGIVTLEDIIEEIIGDISDEFDTEESGFIKISDNCFIFEAKTSLIDFCKYVDAETSSFDDISGEPESLGGLVLEINGAIPEKNDIIHYKNFTFRVESSDNRKINKIRVMINRNS